MLGCHAIDSAVYDVTDDWRSATFTPRELRRLIAAEDVLAVRARTIVCSEELRRRWKSRYGIDASIVRNAVDNDAIHRAHPRDLGADGPHIGYVGTLHESRLDIDLVLRTVEAVPDGPSASGGSRLLDRSCAVALDVPPEDHPAR